MGIVDIITVFVTTVDLDMLDTGTSIIREGKTDYRCGRVSHFFTSIPIPHEDK